METPSDPSAAAAEQAKYKASCDKHVANGLTSNRTIQFLIAQLDQMGCTPPEGFIRCTDCGPLKAVGAFHLLSEEKEPVSISTPQKQPPNKSLSAACSSYFVDALKKIRQSNLGEDPAAQQDHLMDTLNSSNNSNTTTTIKTPEIVLCQQHLSSEGQAHRTIIHELIHAVDTCRSKMDPQSNCIHLACTEIRAENLSNECTFWNELFKIGPHSLAKHGQECVRRRALLSVQAHPKCRERAPDYVDAVMNRCYRDIFPFERHPNEGPLPKPILPATTESSSKESI
jgi:Peptidase M76 family